MHGHAREGRLGRALQAPALRGGERLGVEREAGADAEGPELSDHFAVLLAHAAEGPGPETWRRVPRDLSWR